MYQIYNAREITRKQDTYSYGIAIDVFHLWHVQNISKIHWVSQNLSVRQNNQYFFGVIFWSILRDENICTVKNQWNQWDHDINVSPTKVLHANQSLKL